MTSKLLKEFIEDDLGQDIIEYLLIVSLVGFAAVVSLGTFASNINTAFSRLGSKYISSLSTQTT